jgi:hypothetical protein
MKNCHFWTCIAQRHDSHSLQAPVRRSYRLCDFSMVNTNKKACCTPAQVAQQACTQVRVFIAAACSL